MEILWRKKEWTDNCVDISQGSNKHSSSEVTLLRLSQSSFQRWNHHGEHLIHYVAIGTLIERKYILTYSCSSSKNAEEIDYQKHNRRERK